MIVSFSGHRSPKLFTSDPYGSANFNNLRLFLINELQEMMADGLVITAAITGGALGFDLAVACACNSFRIPYHVYIPCKDQEKKWPPNFQKLYKEVIENAEEMVLICEKYSCACMQLRNQAMSDVSELAVVLWDGKSGGTSNFVKYHSNQKSKTVFNLYSNWMEGGN